MKAPNSYIRIAQGPTIIVAIYKVNGSARAVETFHRQLKPAAFCKGRRLPQ